MWDLVEKKIRIVSYNHTVAHEGFYPFKEKRHWPEGTMADPISFYPTMDSILDSKCWEAYGFDEGHAVEVLKKFPIEGIEVDTWLKGDSGAEPDPVVVDEKFFEPVTVDKNIFWGDMMRKNQVLLMMMALMMVKRNQFLLMILALTINLTGLYLMSMCHQQGKS